MKYFFLLALILPLSLSVKGQVPQAEFSGDRLTGCAPLSVTFTDQSTGNPRFWNWDFGNGQISNQQNSSTTYYTPGTYTVTLVVRNSDGTHGVTKTNYIVVSPSPTILFTQSAAIACQPASVQFTDQSTTPNGSITSWQWNFGDGNTSTQQNPIHNYTTNGFYSPSLVVTDSVGCTASVTYFRNLRIVSGVSAEFVNSVPATCQPPFNIAFQNQSSGPGTLSYTWDFGNGVTSTAANPVVPFSAPGTYTVNLRTISEFGCEDSVQKQVSFTGINTDFSNTDSTCLNSTISFTNNSADTPVTSKWYVNDSLFATTVNSSFYFSAAGAYNVKLVNQYAECADSVTKTVHILGQPAINFTSPVTTACGVPFTATFQDNTPNAASWSWDFGDGQTSNQQNPQHIYSAPGSFAVTLAVVDRFGCSDTLTQADFIRIVPPTVSISNAPAGGCIPFTFSPVANTTAIDGIASYFWDLGNGVTSTSPNPTTIYNTVGSYSLLLRITTNGGCVDSIRIPNGVRTGTPPTPQFSVADSTSCAFGGVQFLDQSVNADGWSWNFGDNTFSSDQNPVHNYSDTGSFNVTLTAYNNGCPASITKNSIVSIAPPVANFSYLLNCAAGTEVAFTNTSIVDVGRGAISYSWSFGDAGNSTSTQFSPTFTYSSPGTYTVSLTATNDTCSHTITREVKILSEVADFSVADDPTCRGLSSVITAIGSDPANIVAYYWKIGNDAEYQDGRTTAPVLPTNGVYDVQLRVVDLNGCVSTKINPGFITVTGPEADLDIADPEACANSLVTFTNNSTSGLPITKYTFDFGDGTVRDFTTGPFTHRYVDTGWFSVRLTVEDQAGCTSSVVLANGIHINEAVAAFTKDTTSYCPGLPIHFADSSRGMNLTYLWDFGDGATSVDQNPVHTYGSTERSYTVKLTVSNPLGCSDSLIRNNYISIRSPKPAFAVSDTMTMCPPFETNFTLQATDYESFYWDFGDGSDISLLENPRHFYNSYGTFEAKLFVIGFGGCVDSTSRTIYVHNPNSTVFDYGPVLACNELNVDFQIQPPSSTSFILNFGDGQVDSTQAVTFSHLYGSPGYYYPSITLFDKTGCQATIGGRFQVSVMGAQPLFGIDRSQFCDSGTVYFTNYTIGNDPVVATLWTLGDGTTSTAGSDIVHSYTQPGNYVARLRVTTQMGCVDEITDTIDVYRTPVASINSADTICINSPALFRGVLAVADTNTIQWNWNFGNGTSSTMRDAAVQFTSAGTYTVQLDTRTQFGCNVSTSKTIHVVPIPDIVIDQDPVAAAGAGVFITPTYTGPIVNYSWSPTSDLSCTNCPTPFATPRATKTYRVTVTDRYGCTNSRDITVVVICSNQNLFIPNTFSPNGDGNNDRFYPRGTGLFRIKSLRIFNRWGETVFEKTNFSGNSSNDGWDGTYKGKKADPDVYVYSIEVICDNGEAFPFKGNVMLLK